MGERVVEIQEHAEIKAVAETKKEFAKAKKIEVSPHSPEEKMIKEVQGQCKEVVLGLEYKVEDFIKYDNEGKYPTREQAIRLFRELEDFLKQPGLDFYSDEFLRKYFTEHDESRLLITGQSFVLKTDTGKAKFDLCVTRSGKFQLHPQKGAPEGVLAEKIQNADDSTKNSI